MVGKRRTKGRSAMGQGFKALVLAALLVSPFASAAPTIVAGSQGTTSRDSAIYEFSRPRAARAPAELGLRIGDFMLRPANAQ